MSPSGSDAQSAVARKYRVHTRLYPEPLEVWAYTAADAETQVQMMFRTHTTAPAYVTRVEPANIPTARVPPGAQRSTCIECGESYGTHQPGCSDAPREKPVAPSPGDAS